MYKIICDIRVTSLQARILWQDEPLLCPNTYWPWSSLIWTLDFPASSNGFCPPNYSYCKFFISPPRPPSVLEFNQKILNSLNFNPFTTDWHLRMVLSDVTIACCNHNNNHPMARGWCHVIEASDFPCSLSWRGPSLSWLQNLREAGGRHSAHDHCAVHIDKLCSFNFPVTRSVRISFNYTHIS